jgi:acetolactate synthase-1/2/3 large subunit
MICVPYVHEVSAAIAAEYFNEVSDDERAYVLVTAGPGITNALTGLAGAYLESRDLLIVGGQVKYEDLAGNSLRQRGIQEIDGIAIASSVCSATARLTQPVQDRDLVDLISAGLTDRRGPVFIEFCLDAQGAAVNKETPNVLGFHEGPS